MHVIVRVTGRTRTRYGKRVFDGLFVTIQATDFRMRPINLEFGALLVVVIPGFPRAAVVTFLTFRAQLFFMRIVFLMAFHTS